MVWKYKCPVCGRTFRDVTKSDLRAQIRRHGKESHEGENLSMEDIYQNS